MYLDISNLDSYIKDLLSLDDKSLEYHENKNFLIRSIYKSNDNELKKKFSNLSRKIFKKLYGNLGNKFKSYFTNLNENKRGFILDDGNNQFLSLKNYKYSYVLISRTDFTAIKYYINLNGKIIYEKFNFDKKDNTSLYNYCFEINFISKEVLDLFSINDYRWRGSLIHKDNNNFIEFYTDINFYNEFKRSKILNEIDILKFSCNIPYDFLKTFLEFLFYVSYFYDYLKLYIIINKYKIILYIFDSSEDLIYYYIFDITNTSKSYNFMGHTNFLCNIFSIEYLDNNIDERIDTKCDNFNIEEVKKLIKKSKTKIFSIKN